jgi:predicted Zn-dependent protease
MTPMNLARNRAFMAATLFAAAACVRNPVTGKPQLSLVSEEQEIELGKESAEEVKASMGTYTDPKLQAYVSALGTRMAARSERPKLPWSFTVIDDAAVNAFALPGGPIFVTRGILTYLNSEAELAGVLGHEIGHITARHSVSQISKAQLAQLGLGVGAILSPAVAKYGQVAGAGLQLLFLKYGRDAEREADELGFRYMREQGFAASEMQKVFTTLARSSAAAGGGRLPAWLSTHPDPGERAEVAAERAAAVPPGGEVGRDAYLTMLSGMVFGEDPRQGFFQGNAFLHPDLRFRVDFPEGWKTRNTPAAVVAVSPEEDAAVQLAAVGKRSPQEAAKRFFAQQGIRALSIEGGSPGALPPNAGYFEAQTQEAVVRGLAAFVAEGGTTFQLVGFTEASRLPTHDGAFRKTVASFRRLEDPAALAVQPARIELVKVPRDMTVQEFQAQFPSTVPVEQVAIVNGVGNGEKLRAGSTAKRIVGGTPTAR